jgi:hypothetical protein
LVKSCLHLSSNAREIATGFLKFAPYPCSGKQENAGARGGQSESCIVGRTGLHHRRHSVGGRYLDGDPGLVPGDRVLHADGRLTPVRGITTSSPRNGLDRYAGMMLSEQRSERTQRALFFDLRAPAPYAACLCIAPVAETDPRIALTDRSIAAHSRPISAAARPSA